MGKTASFTVEDRIKNLIIEKFAVGIKGKELLDDATLGAMGLGMVEIYECIVAVEDLFEVSMDDSDGAADSWTISSLAGCVRKKLKDKSRRGINWKSSFENIVFSGRCTNLRTPLNIHLDLTFRCTSRCIFCYDSSGKGNGQAEMTGEEIKRIIDECKRLDIVQITFGGGEPFIRNEFMELLRYAKKYNFRVAILSNGTLITSEIARELSGCLDMRFDMIQISLDAPVPDVHDAQRGIPGTFEKTMTGIRNLREAGIMPVINTVLTKLNYEYIPGMLSFLIENDLNSIRLLRLHPLGRGKDADFFNKWRLTPEQSESLFNYLNEKRDELMGRLHISNDNACIFPMSAAAIRNSITPRPGREPLSYACGAGTTMLSIGPDGGVYPCSYMYEFPELRVGSVRENNIKELWDNNGLWDRYRNPLVPGDKCRGCNYLYMCKTGCRILSYAVSGDMGAPDPGCAYNPGLESCGDVKGAEERDEVVTNLRNTLCY